MRVVAVGHIVPGSGKKIVAWTDLRDYNGARRLVMSKKLLLGLLFALYAGTCFAQGSLAVTNGDGKFVGWLLAKPPQTDHIQLLTPQGYALTIQRSGYLRNSMNFYPDRILYEEAPCPGGICPINPCGGQAWIEFTDATGYALRGEILQVGDQTGDSFVAMPWAYVAMPGLTIGFVHQKGADGQCVAVTNPPAGPEAVFQVNEINPADYGIRLISALAWAVPMPHSYAVERPEGIFCSGFESCPQN